MRRTLLFWVFLVFSSTAGAADATYENTDVDTVKVTIIETLTNRGWNLAADTGPRISMTKEIKGFGGFLLGALNNSGSLNNPSAEITFSILKKSGSVKVIARRGTATPHTNGTDEHSVSEDDGDLPQFLEEIRSELAK